MNIDREDFERLFTSITSCVLIRILKEELVCIMRQSYLILAPKREWKGLLMEIQ